MSKKILGIDVGITSVGWGVIDDNLNIVDAGVRLFEESTASNNVERREARGSRRTLRRGKGRVIALKNLLIANEIINDDFKHLPNPYHIRVKGLTKKLTNNELATALLHIAKRRGSSLEMVDTETSTNELSPKVILRSNEKALKEFGTVAEVQLKRLEKNGHVRGVNNVFRTEDYIDEVKKLLTVQEVPQELQKEIIEIIKRKRHYSEGPGSENSPSKYGRYREVDEELKQEIINHIKTNNHLEKYLKETFEVKYKETDYRILKSGKIINAKPYSLIDLMRGKCSIYEDELRAPKYSFSAELHNFLNDLNNLKFIKEENRKITIEEKEKIINHLKEKSTFRPNNINGVLKIIGYDVDDVVGFRIDNKSKPEITKFVGFPKIYKVYKNNKEVITDYKLIDEISQILSIYQTEEERIEKLKTFIENKKLVEELSQLTGFKEFHSFSFKALNKLNDEMLKTSYNQQQIITSQGLRKNKEVNKLVVDDSLILSPVARRAHREALKVIEELIKTHGNFSRIVIETTRDKNSSDQRRKIQDSQNRNRRNKLRAEELIKEKGYNVDSNINNNLIYKVLMYQEQHGKCAYTGKEINLNQLIRDPRSYEIDHIIPYSISLDNSQNNKVLVTPLANQRKGNLTPYLYFKSGRVVEDSKIKSFNQFEEIVLSNKNYSNYKKANLLFMEDINKHSVLKQFVNRNLVDTSYAARSLMSTLKEYFVHNDIKTTVTTIRGKQTNLFRHLGIREWNKKNPNNIDLNPLVKDRDKYMHHAIDALIIAGLSEQKSIKWLHTIEKKEINGEVLIHNKYTGELIESDPTKDSDIIKFLLKISELKDRDIKYSWKIDTKPNRQIADATIYSTRNIDGEERVVKKHGDIYQLTNENRHSKFFIKDNKKDLLVYRHDRKTFDILQGIYNQYMHEKHPFAAYKEEHGPIRKYSKKGNGPEIKSLKYLENRLGNHINLETNSKDRNVILLQIKPYRTDIYTDGKTYKFITIRHSDLSQDKGGYYIDEKLYNNKLKEKLIDSNYEFIFSLNRNNIIELEIEEKTHTRKELVRFIATGNDVKNVIECKSIEMNSDKRNTPTIGRKIKKIKKFNVSPTGKIHEVSKERLQLRI